MADNMPAKNMAIKKCLIMDKKSPDMNNTSNNKTALLTFS